MIDYQNELSFQIFPPLDLAYEVLSSDEASGETKNHALTVLYATLNKWRELDNYFSECNRQAHNLNRISKVQELLPFIELTRI